MEVVLLVVILLFIVIQTVFRSSDNGRRFLLQKFTKQAYIKEVRRDGNNGSIRAIVREVGGKPSYYRVCSEILLNEQVHKPSVAVHIREERLICVEEHNVSGALTNTLLSSWLAEQGRSVAGGNVDYRHFCGQTGSIKPVIQHFLPSPVVMDPSMQHLTKQDLLERCQEVVVSVNDSRKRHGMVLAMFPEIFPMIRDNLDVAVRASEGSRAAAPRKGVLAPTKQQSGGFSETALIILSCADTRCGDMWVPPYYTFLAEIPASVQTIDIVADPSCQGSPSHCMVYVNGLVGVLRHMRIRASVDVIFAAPAHLDAFSRMMKADYVFCTYGSICLLPALSREPGTFWILDPTTRGHLESLSPNGHIRTHSAPTNLESLKRLQSVEAINRFAHQQPDPSSGVCRFLRGQSGHWFQDMRYAADAQYGTTFYHHSGAAERQFQENRAHNKTGGLQFRPSTTYLWRESRYPVCNFAKTTRERVCSILARSNVRRLFFLGDSLNLQMALSLWMLMGPERDFPVDDKTHIRRKVECRPADGEPFDFSIEFLRNDELLETSNQVSASDEVKNCHNYCYPWKQGYMESNARTILVVNTGAHLNNRDLFEAAIPRFIRDFDSLDRPNDIVLMRTLVPGHKQCGRPGLKPFQTFEEYLMDVKGQGDRVKDTYNWDVFSSYNDYMAQQLMQRRAGPRQARMELLDVFPMTVLRADGHVADEFKAPQARRTDCLHYNLPGPIDWWTHLLFNNLSDII